MNRLLLLFVLALAGCSASSSTGTSAPAPAPSSQLRQLNWRTGAVLPHDSGAFTQGLLWHDGFLYESTGIQGKSEVRRVEVGSGQVLKRWKLPANVFGEGLAYLKGRFYNLTWQSNVGYVLDENFKPVSQFNYTNEGWGLTSDGQKLLQSDGTDVLTWRDPKNFASLGTLRVTRNGLSVLNLNELEWIRGYVWANVWQSDEVVVIDPRDGKVVAQLDLSGILPADVRTGREDVLNGIAFDPKQGRVFVTGKKWPRLYWIQVDEMPSR